MIFIKFSIIIFVFLSSKCFATNINVVDLEYLVNNNNQFILFLDEIEKDQLIYKKKFEEIELDLQKMLDKIEENKLILNSNELDKQITRYNNEFKLFDDQIKNFNLHYENQINYFRDTIFQTIIELLKEYSLNNEIDLILDSKNYIISSNLINITDKILINLNKVEIDIKLEKFK